MLRIQKQRMTIIGELLAIQGEHKVQRNLERCIASLAAIQRSLDQSQHDQVVQKDHRLTLHTIKGEARALWLRELSSSVHLAEGFLFELSASGRIPWDQGQSLPEAGRGLSDPGPGISELLAKISSAYEQHRAAP
jgi:HPt (histidine-containing phosphotransfer) domain-containing protein